MTLDMTRLLHTSTHNICGYPHRSSQPQFQQKLGRGPRPHLYQRSYWQLMAAEEESLTLGMGLLVG